MASAAGSRFRVTQASPPLPLMARISGRVNSVPSTPNASSWLRRPIRLDSAPKTGCASM